MISQSDRKAHMNGKDENIPGGTKGNLLWKPYSHTLLNIMVCKGIMHLNIDIGVSEYLTITPDLQISKPMKGREPATNPPWLTNIDNLLQKLKFHIHWRCFMLRHCKHPIKLIAKIFLHARIPQQISTLRTLLRQTLFFETTFNLETLR